MAAHGLSEKSPLAFRTIGEISGELDVPQHVLRFWELRFAAIRPLKRSGGRRYYRPEDVDLIRGIRQLLYADGLSIRGVQKLLRERGARFVAALGRGEFATRDLLPAALAEATEEARLQQLQLGLPGSAPELPANVHRFPPERETPRVAATAEEARRARLALLLYELLELKSQLTAAREAFAQRFSLHPDA